MPIKRDAAKALGAWIAARVPELQGKFAVGQPDPEKLATYSGLTIMPGSFRFESAMEGEIDEVSQTTAVLTEVGSMEGSMELRIYARTPYEREILEEKVTQALVSREGSPGTVVVHLTGLVVGGIRWPYEPPVTFTLDDSDWVDEFAFNKCRFSFIDLDCTYELLIARADVPTITSYVLAVTQDMVTDPVPTTSFEQFLVADNGTTTRYV